MSCLEVEITAQWWIDICLEFSFKEFSSHICGFSTLLSSAEFIETMVSSCSQWLSLKESVDSIGRIALHHLKEWSLLMGSILVSCSWETYNINSMEAWFFENMFLLNPNALMRSHKNLVVWNKDDYHKEADKTQPQGHRHQIWLLKYVWIFKVHYRKDYLQIRPCQCLFELISQNLQF